MPSRRFRFMCWIIIGITLVMSLIYASTRRQCDVRSPAHYGPAGRKARAQARNFGPRHDGKITLPVELSVGLAEPNTQAAGKPVDLIVSARCTIPVASSAVTLRIPSMGSEPARTEVLWSGNSPGLVDQTVEYAGAALPLGRYKFVAIFQFTRNGKNAEKLTVSKSLYLDVRPTAVLSSNVSFEQIKRVELWAQLQERVLISMRPGLAMADRQARLRELALIEARDPGIIARKIEELKQSDPAVARKVMELNLTEVDATETRPAPQNIRNGPPSPEVAVPLSEAFHKP
jgi:hypothetical protein